MKAQVPRVLLASARHRSYPGVQRRFASHGRVLRVGRVEPIQRPRDTFLWGLSGTLNRSYNPEIR